jgi:hypothetical protein
MAVESGGTAVKNLSQLAAFFAIAGGAGLLACSRKYRSAYFRRGEPRDHYERQIFAASGRLPLTPTGWGTAFITLGSLTLGVPWVNSASKRKSVSPENNRNEAAR